MCTELNSIVTIPGTSFSAVSRLFKKLLLLLPVRSRKSRLHSQTAYDSDSGGSVSHNSRSPLSLPHVDVSCFASALGFAICFMACIFGSDSVFRLSFGPSPTCASVSHTLNLPNYASSLRRCAALFGPQYRASSPSNYKAVDVGCCGTPAVLMA